MKWHILTGEYPPGAGGVGDYTALLASALANAGDTVDVWVGGSVERATSGPCGVHALPDIFGPRSRTVLQEAWAAAPGVVLLQYVPNAIGLRGMNVAFCRWLLRQRRLGCDVRVMFHEPYFYFTLQRPWRNAAALVQRVMAMLLVRAARERYYASANWHAYLGPYGAATSGVVLPIPSTIPSNATAGQVREFRARVADGGAKVVGHFGTFGEHVGDELREILPLLLEHDRSVCVVLIGRNADRFRQELVRRLPSAGDRVHATGEMAASGVAIALSACDVLIQPYPDGVTTRRTSVMAGLCNGVATVSTAGALTEPVWRQTRALVLAPRGEPGPMVTEVCRLLDDPEERTAQAARGREAYLRHFSIEQTVTRLRSIAPAALSA